MINLKPPFRVAKYSDFETLESDRLALSSYKNIAFPLGCSRSEFKMTLDDSELCLLEKGNVIGFARIKSIMFTHIYLDIYCVDETKGFAKALSKLQDYLIKEFGVDKFFIQLFDYESLEIDSLISNEYTLEATLKNHVWLKGEYQDLHIYGSPLNV